MNIIITGGNSEYFDYLKVFTISLRENAKYKDKIIICENVIENGKFKVADSFSENELSFFKKYDIDIIKFHELLKEENLSRELIDAIYSEHRCYPLKQIYSCLISKRYLHEAENICYFDADMYFQRPLEEFFNQFKENKIYVAPEKGSVGECEWMKKVLSISDFSKIGSDDHFKKEIYSSRHLGAGFFGGKAKIFNKFTSLFWLIASNNLIKFHNDQPLLNIILSYFNYPYSELDEKWLLHINLVINKIEYNAANKLIKFNSEIPHIIHFNGGQGSTFFNKHFRGKDVL